ncbi:hypothetical protein U9I19_000208 [Bacillus phage KKP_4049]
MDEKERKPEVRPIQPFVIQFSTDEEDIGSCLGYFRF